MNWPQAGNLALVLSFPLSVVLWAVTRGLGARFWRRWVGPIFGTLSLATLVGFWRLGWLRGIAQRLGIPPWMLLVLALWAVVLSLVAWVFARSRAARRDWRDYVSDEMFGAVWRWRYTRNQVQEDDLSPRCPERHCRCRLEPRSTPERQAVGIGAVPITLVCPHCGFKREFDSDFERLKRDVVAEIERRIDTGEFQKRLETDS